MSRTVKASVIVPTIGRRKQLQDCLSALAVCDPGPAEVVVVDQSRAGVAKGVAEALDDARFRVVDDDLRGPARARNRGTRAARFDLLLFIDDDCVARSDWIGDAARLHDLHSDALLTGQVLPGGGSPWVPSTVQGTEPLDFTGTEQCAVLYSNNMVVPRTGLLDIGAFDERFPGGEDNDLCYRWLKAGRTLLFQPELVVEHMDWRTIGELESVQVDYARAQGMFYAKHLRSGDLRMLVFLLSDLRERLRLVGNPRSGPGPIPFVEELRSMVRSWRRFAPSGELRAAE